MTTLREVYIEGIIAALEATPGFPAKVERSVNRAFTRQESPVLVVHRGGEDVNDSLNSSVFRACEVLVSVVTRSDVPDQVADEIMEIAHPVIMAYRGDRMMKILEAGTNAPVFSPADSQACLLTTRYNIQYTTARRSLTA
ncbi:MAG: hypothetical protein K2X55_01005 [Burkholderiaceae bacterium]|nr:hypothetical protein [Burkholderiaceae bacterium]